MTLISDKPFHVDIITPERVRYEGEALMLSLPGVEGQLGILANHAPILALLQAGRVTLQTREQTVQMAVGEGFVKMSRNRAVCLVDFAENAEEIDASKVQARLAELERDLAAETVADKRDAVMRRMRAEKARLEVARG